MGVVCWWGPRWVESSTRPVLREGERKPRVEVDSDEHVQPAPDDPPADVGDGTGGHAFLGWAIETERALEKLKVALF